MHAKLIELENSFQASILTQIFDPLLECKQIELWIKRDDLIHPVISGNKWRKLKYILDYALTNECHTLISMGGAYSNHLHAMAYVARQLDIKAIGYIRGEHPESLSPTLRDLKNWEMELRFISRTEYRKLREDKQPDGFPVIKNGSLWIPEGGAIELALQGVGELVSEIDMEFDVICVPCGTGATCAGLINSVSDQCWVYGVSALKATDFLHQEVEQLLKVDPAKRDNWSILLDYHFGGFAKTNNELHLFIEDFEKKHGIELEPVYTGKMFYGLFDLIQQNRFKPGQKIMAIHTGGLQGKRSLSLE